MPSKSDKIIKFNWTPRETRWINAVLIEYILIMDKKSACGGLFRNSKAEVMGGGGFQNLYKYNQHLKQNLWELNILLILLSKKDGELLRLRLIPCLM